MPFITDATLNDLPAILKLQKFCYRENAKRYNNDHITPITQTLREVEDEFRFCVFLKAEEESRIIGSIRACRKEATCFIVRLFVHPDYQNSGIGTMLMNAIEERFPDVDRYELFTGYRDEKNLHLYRKLGYRKTGKEEKKDGVVFHYLEKLRDHTA
ncbi:MAG: GNAT family N-acetyltransferase [Chitinispirillaceae bacterium]|nr:GNAT family N-acetyltransferase [Chitinispirillaceae bacterium]